MLVLVTYDVDTTSKSGEYRLRKVAKECMNYGQRVQNSVFECFLSESQFVVLKSKLMSILDFEKDSIRLYFLGNNWHGKVECLGKKLSYKITDELII